MSVSPSPNAEHIEFWNDVLAEPFLRFRDMFVTMGDAHSRGPLDRLGLKPGDRARRRLRVRRDHPADRASRPPGRTRARHRSLRAVPRDRPRRRSAAGIDNAEFAVVDAQTTSSPSSTSRSRSDMSRTRRGINIAAPEPGGRLLMIVCPRDQQSIRSRRRSSSGTSRRHPTRRRTAARDRSRWPIRRSRAISPATSRSFEQTDVLAWGDGRGGDVPAVARPGSRIFREGGELRPTARDRGRDA